MYFEESVSLILSLFSCWLGDAPLVAHEPSSLTTELSTLAVATTVAYVIKRHGGKGGGRLEERKCRLNKFLT